MYLTVSCCLISAVLYTTIKGEKYINRKDTTSEGLFLCSDGTSMQWRYVCDGSSDGSDDETAQSCERLLQHLSKHTLPVFGCDGLNQKVISPGLFCDGHTDCPGATDEQCVQRSCDDLCINSSRCSEQLANISNCTEGKKNKGVSSPTSDCYYKCRSSKLCVPERQLCDSRYHCPLMDDEDVFYCGGQRHCAQGCTCIDSVIRCHNLNLTVEDVSAALLTKDFLTLMHSARVLDFSGNQLDNLTTFLVQMDVSSNHAFFRLNLSYHDNDSNHISSLNDDDSDYVLGTHVFHLNLSDNNIEVLDLSILLFPNLHVLDLTRNAIISLTGVFADTKPLLHLDIYLDTDVQKTFERFNHDMIVLAGTCKYCDICVKTIDVAFLSQCNETRGTAEWDLPSLNHFEKASMLIGVICLALNSLHFLTVIMLRFNTIQRAALINHPLCSFAICVYHIQLEVSFSLKDLTIAEYLDGHICTLRILLYTVSFISYHGNIVCLAFTNNILVYCPSEKLQNKLKWVICLNMTLTYILPVLCGLISWSLQSQKVQCHFTFFLGIIHRLHWKGKPFFMDLFYFRNSLGSNDTDTKILQSSPHHPQIGTMFLTVSVIALVTTLIFLTANCARSAMATSYCSSEELELGVNHGKNMAAKYSPEMSLALLISCLSITLSISFDYFAVNTPGAKKLLFYCRHFLLVATSLVNCVILMVGRAVFKIRRRTLARQYSGQWKSARENIAASKPKLDSLYRNLPSFISRGGSLTPVEVLSCANTVSETIHNLHHEGLVCDAVGTDFVLLEYDQKHQRQGFEFVPPTEYPKCDVHEWRKKRDIEALGTILLLCLDHVTPETRTQEQDNKA